MTTLRASCREFGATETISMFLGRNNRCELLATLYKFILYEKIELLADRINDQANKGKPHCERGIDACAKPNPQKGAFRLRCIRNITINVENPSAQCAAQTQARLESKKNSGVHKSRRAPRCLPFRIIRHVGNHHPKQRHGWSPTDGPKNT